MIDRQEVNRALAKAIAFKAVNKHSEAAAWAARLVRLLECHDILNSSFTNDFDSPETVKVPRKHAPKGCPDHPPGFGVVGCPTC